MPGAAAMPRAAADTPQQIAWAAAALFFGGLPHLLAVVPWVALLVAAVAAWRIAAAARGWRLPSLWIRVPATVLGFLAVALSYRSISGVDAGSALLLVMGAMKLLETRNERDRILVVFIGLFLLFAVFLREQAIWSSAWLAVGTLGTGTALVQSARRERLLPPGRAVRLAGRLLLQGLPLAGALFVLFPRIPGPFWSLPEAPSGGRSGLAEEVRPGDISALALSDEIALRARFPAAVPPAGELYWRGPVLEQFDGRGWTAAQPPPPAPAPPMPGAGGGLQYDYELVLEPQGRRWLLALETPLRWSVPGATLSPAMQLLSATPLRDRLAYRARSVPDGIGAVRATPQALAANLRLPPDRNPRTLALATRLRAEVASDRAFLQRVLALFGEEPFRYTLTPPLLGPQAVDDFLFRTHAGFCEHYASALAVLARAGGIPARVVVGYQGGEHNPIGDYWIVRQAHAHAWVEVWLEGAWRRVDPTAAVAPGRIEQGPDASLAGTPGRTRQFWRANPLLGRMVLSWDAANAAWDRWVLAFGPEAQDRLLLALGFRVPQTAQLAVLAGVAAALCLLLPGLVLRRRASRPGDRPARLYATLCQRLAGCVRARQPGESAGHYAAAIALARPDLATEVRAMTDLYLRLRYGGSRDPAGEAEFSRRLRAFRPARGPAARGRR